MSTPFERVFFGPSVTAPRVYFLRPTEPGTKNRVDHGFRGLNRLRTGGRRTARYPLCFVLSAKFAKSRAKNPRENDRLSSPGCDFESTPARTLSYVFWTDLHTCLPVDPGAVPSCGRVVWTGFVGFASGRT